LDPRDRELLERALANTSTLLASLEAMLTLTRAQHAQPVPEPVDLGALVDEVAALLDAQMVAAEATITADDLPTILVDPALVRILLQNLLVNAAKYRDPARPLRITVTATRVPGGWEITVADNGRGIPPADRE